MKKSNRLSVRVLALLMTFVMLFSLSATVMAAKTEVVSTDYYTLSYDSDSDIPEVVLSLNAEALGSLIAERKFNKAELAKFLPDFVATVLVNKEMPSIGDMIDIFPDELLSLEQLKKMIPVDLLKKYFDADLIEKVLPKSEWSNVLPIDSFVATELDYIAANYPAVITSLVNNDVLTQFANDAEAVNALKNSNEVIDALLNNADVRNALLNDNALIDSLLDADLAQTLVDEGVVDQADVEDLLGSAELAEVAACAPADQAAKAIELALKNHKSELLALASAAEILNAVGGVEAIYNNGDVNVDDLVDALGGASVLVNTVGVDTLVSAVGADKIIETVGLTNAVKSVLTNTDKTYLVSLLQKVITHPDFDLANVLAAVDKATLKTELKNIFIQTFMNDIKSVDMLYHDDVDTSVNIYNFDLSTLQSELNIQDVVNAMTLSIPDTNDLINMKDGDTAYLLGFTMAFNDIDGEYGFQVRVVLEGDTTTLNAYAEKLATVLTYEVEAKTSGAEYGLTVDVSDFDDNAFISFASILRKALATDRMTDAQKAELFTIFTKEGQDLVDALEAFDFNRDWIEEKYVPYLEEIRDKMIVVLERVLDASSVDYRKVTLASLFDEAKMQFVLDDDFTAPVDKIINKLCNVVGVTMDQFDMIFNSYDKSVSYNINFSFGMDEVYRVRYFDENDDLIYTTFLPAGTVLAVINDYTTELNGKAGEFGWADKDGNIVTVTPDDQNLDLYPANEEAEEVQTYTATFVADGKIVDKVTFKEGDTKLTREPRVPEKLGYYGKWENYKLADKDITIKAVYTAKTYTVIYNANGGTGSMANQILTFDKADTLSACGFVREGYDFLGWNTNADGTGTFYADQQVVKNMTIVDGVILYAQWHAKAPNVHTATFMANGVVVDKVTFEEGDTELSRVPAVPARVGYTGAWEGYVLSNVDITINAEYTANEYVVVFDANGGVGANMPNQTMTYDTFAELTANTYTNAGHTFAGWNTKADGSGDSYANGENVKNLAESGEVTLFAQWDVEITTTETTTETTTTPVVDDDGFNWIALVVALAVLAVGGGVAGVLVYNKKKSV